MGALATPKRIFLCIIFQSFFLWYFAFKLEAEPPETTTTQLSTHEKTFLDERTSFIDGLRDWTWQNGMKFPPVKVNYTEKGQTLIADDNIPKGELFRVPFDLLLSNEFNRKELVWNSNGWQTIREEGFDASDIEAVFLLYELQLGKQSWFYPYIQGLTPYDELTLPIFWNEEEQMLIEPKSNRQDMLMVEDDLKLSYEKVKQLSSKYPLLFQPPFFTYEKYKWACAILWSHSFNVLNDRNGDTTFVMVPLVDLMNHYPLMDTTWYIDEDAHQWVLNTNKNFMKGDEIVINYGSMPNNRMLKWFGFAIENNPHDTVQVDILQYGFEPANEAKKSILSKFGCFQRIPLAREFVSRKLYECARVAVYKTSQEVSLPSSGDASTLRIDRLGCANEKAALLLIKRVLERSLAAFTTSIEKDQELLLSGVLSKKGKFAVITRKGHKEILVYHIKKATEALETEKLSCKGN